MTRRLISVAVPVAVDMAFTYIVPDNEPMPAPGARVLVPFGPRAVVGVVRPEPGTPPTQSDEAESASKLRPIAGVLDDGEPALLPELLALCEWMTEYYVAPVGEVYRLALPGLLTRADARHARISAAGEAALGGLLFASTASANLSNDGRRLLEHLREAGDKGLAIAQLTALKPKVAAPLRCLAELEAAQLCEVSWLDLDSSARTELHVRRTDVLRGGGGDEETLQSLLGRSKQRRGLLDELEGRLEQGDGWVPLSDLRGSFPRIRQLLPALLDANLIQQEARPRRLDPFSCPTDAPSVPQTPTADQARALAALREDLEARRFAPSLLHGVTGSGKTEVYLQLIAWAREMGRSAIVLVPEIALTPQLSDRFRARFGDEVAVLHSALTPRQRLDAWQQIRSGERPIVIGARSAMFAPLRDLGVIVVDEEHDPSFKQEEGVRYNARDVALVRGRDAGAVVVLGSATPSLETFANATRGRYRALTLRTRPTPRPLPEVQIVPLSVHRADPSSMMTAVLREALANTVAAGEQAILFLNRRGYTTTVACVACGSFQQCPDCSAPGMTYHLQRNRLMCHWCGHIEAMPEHCRACGQPELEHGSAGTERIELALGHAVPGIRVLRLDRDAAKGRQLLDTLDAFRNHEADVLVGTQMLSKGHDFPGVTLVGVLQGDHGLAIPDPRASERVFQLLTQVSGRAGRGERAGRVIVQAWAVKHPAITFAAVHDYEGFAAQELAAREDLGNPPAGYLALIRIAGNEERDVQQRAQTLAAAARERMPKIDGVPADVRPGGAAGHRFGAFGGLERPVELLGPVPAPILRVNRRVRWQLLLRSRRRDALRTLLARLRPLLGSEGSGLHRTLAIVDVDPQSLM